MNLSMVKSGVVVVGWNCPVSLPPRPGGYIGGAPYSVKLTTGAARFPARLFQHPDIAPLDHAEAWRGLPNLVVDEALREVPVMLLDHLGVDVAEILRQHHERHSGHHAQAGV